jgi:anaerobic selenocysteine-containing dehydrogenase
MMVGNNPLISSYGSLGGLPSFSPTDILNRNKKRGIKLICIDPRRTELAKRADVHLQPIPGEDPTLLAAILRFILKEGLEDSDFADEYVEGLDELRAAIEPFDLDYAAERAGVPAEQIEVAARLFAAGPRGAASTGTGPSMAPRSSLSEHLIGCLNAVCGRFNRAGETIANPGVLSPARPYTAAVTPPDALEPFFRRGERPRVRGLLPLIGELPTAALAEEILMPGEGQVRALITSGGNPVVAFPDQLRTIEALDSLDLHVCLDVYMGATAKRADYVIASRLSLERPDVPTTIDTWFEQPYTQYTPAILEPDFDVLAEWEFFYGLAQRMGTEIQLAGGSLDLESKPTSDEVLDLVYARSRIPMSEVRKYPGGHIYEEVRVEVEPKPPDSDGRFALTPVGVVEELAAVRRESMAAEFVPGFDPAIHTHRLISRRLRHVVNSTGQHLSGLRKEGETNYAWLHPDDLEGLGLESGDVIEIRSTRAAIYGVVASSDDLRPGVISMAHAYGGAPAADGKVREIGAPTGRLIDATVAFDPLTGMPCQSAIPVSIKAVGEAALE